tara:strand:- start:1267 stop:2253 length:987 start_codon:yes stop_codon:yes gene_type:complete
MVTHLQLKKFGVKYNKEFKIAGIHKMKKAELIKAIENKLIKSRKEIKQEYKQLQNTKKEKPKPKPKFKIDESKQPKTTPSKIVMSRKPDLNTKKITPKKNDLNYSVLNKYFTYINMAYSDSLFHGNNTSKYYDNAEKAYEKELPIFNSVINTYDKIKYQREHRKDLYPDYRGQIIIKYPDEEAITTMKKFKSAIKRRRKDLALPEPQRTRRPVGDERYTTFPARMGNFKRPTFNIKLVESKTPSSVKIDVKNRKIKAMEYLNKYNKTIYQTLKPYGISSEAKAKQLSSQELKKIYRKILLEQHPDKGGSTDKFNRYKKAIQILMDTVK